MVKEISAYFFAALRVSPLMILPMIVFLFFTKENSLLSTLSVTHASSIRWRIWLTSVSPNRLTLAEEYFFAFSVS